jgi:hypothetical protein
VADEKQTAMQKGNSLESAVKAIEEVILRNSPAVKEKTYRIESKKIINAGGVRHEIDVFVTFELGPGYSPIFIFECKNWQDAVGKNEIIIFSEKIDAAGAQRGFFVAKSFTGDADAQAKKDARMELLTVTEHDPASYILPFGYQSTFLNPKHIRVNFRKKGSDGKNTTKVEPLKADIKIKDFDGTFQQYMDIWVQIAMNESMMTFPSGKIADGVYERETHSEKRFGDGQFLLDGNEIETVAIDVTFEITLLRPAVKAVFDVGGRGRVVTFEAHQVGAVTMNEVQFTEVPGPPPGPPTKAVESERK